MLTQPKVARILFDESHSEAWTIRRERAEQIDLRIKARPASHEIKDTKKAA